MTTDLSTYDSSVLPNADALVRQRYAIIVADWNKDYTWAMAEGTKQTLLENGVAEENILVQHVPGTIELTYAAGRLIPQPNINNRRSRFDAIIVIGCVIKGETPHFDYVCESVTNGVAMLNSKGVTPVIFSVLTVLNEKQAKERSGGKLGNKGIEGAVTAIRMANLG
ncbi:MAG: 6,7-dimethyl-8-ribityllumazine synthase [Paludibacteraceae bacterium]|nr:6,7-dimethyl-8-ribityllumazine synthase [Paludibacteraceae bacterium]